MRILKPTGGTNMRRLGNRTEVKRYRLDRAQMLRPVLGMRRSSDETVQNFESRLRNLADDMIRRHPRMGKTIKP